MILKVAILVIIGFASWIEAEQPNWSKHLELHSSFKVQWRVEKDKEGAKWLRMKASAPTSGYIGIGFSSNGAMAGSDFVIAWVDDHGQGHLNDYYGIGNEAPILDSSQDVQLISALQSSDGTRIEFLRRWDTCDDKDYKLTTDTVRLMWAFGDADPPMKKDGSHSLQWHGKNRGVKSIYLEDDTTVAPFPDAPGNEDPNVKHWDVYMGNVEVKDETLYHCKIVKAPTLTKKHHYIGYRPIIDIPNKEFLHHFVLYECHVPGGSSSDIFEKHLNETGSTCYTNVMPPHWGQHCLQFLVVWLFGSEGEMLPEHVGIPLGEEHGGATYFMVETHYNNLEKRTFRDNSALRMFYTDKLRENDAGMIVAGHSVSQFHMIPPGMKNFNIFGICSSECTEKTFPPEGIKIINVLLHAHIAGRKIRLRHVRNGVELAPIGKDDFYDFNYQQTRMLKEEIAVLPGDELLTECGYSTADRNEMVLGGLSTLQEMCQSFLVYYPRIELNNCRTQPEFYTFFNALGIQNVTGNILKAIHMPYDSTIFNSEYEPSDNAKDMESAAEGSSYSSVFDLLSVSEPASLNKVNVGDYLKNRFDWKANAKSVEKSVYDGQQYAFCTMKSRKRAQLKSNIIPYTRITKPYVEPMSNYCSIKSNAVQHIKSSATIPSTFISYWISSFIVVAAALKF